jgi:hypothetical protein
VHEVRMEAIMCRYDLLRGFGKNFDCGKAEVLREESAKKKNEKEQYDGYNYIIKTLNIKAKIKNY